MKSSLAHLPLNKQQELERVTKLIVETADPEKVILYGSYATGEWQEDRYAEKHIVYSFDSDYDILVITKAGDKRKDYEITSQITNRSRYRVPINVITHDIAYVNEQLQIGQYFFADIISEGILLYDLKLTPFVEPKEHTRTEKKNIAEQDFKKWFNSGTEFLIDAQNAMNRGSLKNAAFYLHQAAERFYNALLLVYTGYKPKTHNLDKLRAYTKNFSGELYLVFPCNTQQEENLYSLLVKGYVDARYSDEYFIEKNEVASLIERVKSIKQLTEFLSLKKIESF